MNLFKNNIIRSAAPMAVAIAAFLFAWWMSLAPRPVPASAPAEAFSAERAHHHIAVNCTEPQPAGSLNNDRAYQYIQDELDRLDVEYEPVLYYDRTRGNSVERRRAVLGRIRGTDPTRAFAVDAHFDSVTWGPGAADDFSGIAAMLESARALKASPPLKNDIIFVFADQEEFNMGGARAFRNHPWFNETGVVLGLETRGNSGPALMFETSPQNGFVVRELARSGAGARTNSIMYDFYARMPFASDFNNYKDAVAGLNVAYINNFDYYHTMLDNPDNVSLASLQHHGNYTLELARHFGNISLDNCYAPDVAYFNTIGNHMIVYPMSWNWPFTIVALALFVAVMAYGFTSGRLCWRGVLSGFLGMLCASLAAAAVVGLIILVIFMRFREAALYQNNVYALGFTLMGFAAFLVMTALIRPFTRPQEFLAGVLPWWVLGLVVFQLWAPGGANTIVWPLATGTIYLLILLRSANGQPTDNTLAWSVALALPPLMLISPMLVMSFYAVTLMASFIVVPTVLLLCGFVAPQLYLYSRAGLVKAAGILVLCGIVIVIAAYVGTLPSPTSPKLNTLAYAVDFDAEQAFWLSYDEELDEWTSLYIPEETQRIPLTEFLPGDRHAYFKAEAPLPPYPKSTIEVHEDYLEDGRRILECHLNSSRDAKRVWLRVTSDIAVHGAEILGHRLDGAEEHWNAYFAILPREGASLRLEVAPDAPLVIEMRETSSFLPSLPDFIPRPDHIIPEPNRRLDRSRSMHSDMTYSLATFDLGVGVRE